MYSITPIDGRYNNICNYVSKIYSEAAYINYRYKIELEYYNFLIIFFNEKNKIQIENLTDLELENIKTIENKIKHDLKSIEYFILDKYKDNIIKKYVHFGLTTNDINSVAYTLQYNDILDYIYNIEAAFNENLQKLINKCNNITIIAKTHGQKAVPTKLDKEIKVFQYRLDKIGKIPKLKTTKFGGAVGNLSAHYYIYPTYDWANIIKDFLNNSFNLERQEYTTQIDNYDELCVSLNLLKQRATIYKSLGHNLWLLINDNIFLQTYVNTHVGSSTMPQKINPISIENSFGNYELLVALIETMTRNLPQSNHQRDLKDSTMMRNMGSIMSYYLIFLNNLEIGVNSLYPNIEHINNIILDSPETVLEGIQYYLKMAGLDGYELTKTLFRTNKKIQKKDIDEFLISIGHEELCSLTPDTYLKK